MVSSRTYSRGYTKCTPTIDKVINNPSIGGWHTYVDSSLCFCRIGNMNDVPWLIVFREILPPDRHNRLPGFSVYYIHMSCNQPPLLGKGTFREQGIFLPLW